MDGASTSCRLGRGTAPESPGGSLGPGDSVGNGVPSRWWRHTCAELEAIPAEAIDTREGQEVVFNAPRGAMTFTAEEFLLSFSLPNCYFHATTAYDILRSRGTPIGKLDFMGRLRLEA